MATVAASSTSCWSEKWRRASANTSSETSAGVRVIPSANAAQVADRFRAAVAQHADLIFAAGGSATDPTDRLFEGLRLAGGSIDQVGVPVDPGTACWIGHLDACAVLGLASCELFGRAGALALILPRVLAGEALDRALVRGLAYGGLLSSGPAPA